VRIMTNQTVLHNIRILDFSWVLAGPYATRILADFGAEMILLLERETGLAETVIINKLTIFRQLLEKS